MKLTLFIEAGEKTVYFDQPIVVGEPEGPRGSGGYIMLKKATVFWNYNNIMKKFENNLVSFDGKKTYAPEGYLDFDAIETFVKSLATGGKTVDFKKNAYDGTSRIKTTGKLKFGKMSLLLGFNEDDVIGPDDKWANSKNQVDINKGLRYVEILCDAVESERSLDNGRRSDLVSTLPITSEQRLKGAYSTIQTLSQKLRFVRVFIII